MLTKMVKSASPVTGGMAYARHTADVLFVVGDGRSGRPRGGVVQSSRQVAPLTAVHCIYHLGLLQQLLVVAVACSAPPSESDPQQMLLHS